MTERARLHAELKRRAEFDVLTACSSRSSIMAALEEALAKGPVAVVFLDLDGFKAINDTHGHAIGDAVLEVVGRRLRNVIRARDLVGRLGGDEFLVVCSEVGEPSSVMTWTERLAARVSEPIGIGALTVSIRASIGVALSGESTSAERLVADADVAMYQAKRTSSGPRRYTRSLRGHPDEDPTTSLTPTDPRLWAAESPSGPLTCGLAERRSCCEGLSEPGDPPDSSS